MAVIQVYKIFKTKHAKNIHDLYYLANKKST